MKLKKILTFLLSLAAVICMFALCSVSASARNTAFVTIRSEPSYGGKVAFTSNVANDWGSNIGKSIWIDEETVTISAKAEAGYKFVGWSAPVNNSRNPVTLTGLKNKQNYTIVAKFEKIPETEYDIEIVNGTAKDYLSQATETKSVAGRKVYITADPAPEAGMVFDRWRVLKGNVTLADEFSANTTFVMPKKAVLIEAEYREAEYTNSTNKVSVYFQQGDNYGSGESEMQVVYGTTLALPSDPFNTVPDGYSFVGWHEAETDTLLTPGTKVLITDTTYYFATYEGYIINLNYAYEGNSGASGSMGDYEMPVKIGDYITLPECAFIPPEGKIFKCWKLPDGEAQPGDRAKITDPNGSGAYIVTAVFEDDPDQDYFFITYDNGMEDEREHYTYTEKVKKKISKYGNSATVLGEPKFGVFKPKGLVFDCWDLGKPGDTVTFDGKKLTVTAKWKKEGGDISKGKIEVNQGKNIDDHTKKEYKNYENYIYCGQPITPIYSVYDNNGALLTEGVDYKAEYSNNVKAGRKTAIITVTGINSYSGTKTGYFTIQPLELDYKNSAGKAVSVNYGFNINDCIYTGKQVKPEITLIYKKSNGIKYQIPLSDFSITYPKSTALGSYTVKISPKGKNVSSDKKTYSLLYYVKPPQQKIKGLTYNNGNDLTVYFTKLTKTLNSVQIQISTTKDFSKKKTFTSNGKGVEALSIKAQKDLPKSYQNKTLYVRVRYNIKCSNSKTGYAIGQWSSVKSVECDVINVGG